MAKIVSTVSIPRLNSALAAGSDHNSQNVGGGLSGVGDGLAAGNKKNEKNTSSVARLNADENDATHWLTCTSDVADRSRFPAKTRSTPANNVVTPSAIASCVGGVRQTVATANSRA